MEPPTADAPTPHEPPGPRDPAAVEAQLRLLLSERPGGFVDDGHDLVVTVDDRRLYLLVLMFGPDDAVIQVMAPLLGGVADSDELCEAVATAETGFGRLLLIAEEGGTRAVELVVRFGAVQLSREVLDHAIASVAATAGRLDPALEAQFGARWTLEGPT